MEEHRTSSAQSAALWLIAVGLVLTGYGAWEQWGTNLVAWHNQQEAMNDLANGWPNPDDAKPGQTIAVLRIPAFGPDFEVPVIEGVNSEDLSSGVGHYPTTALPGEVGNFAVAGHRATHGEPFAYLDKVGRGDVVIVETSTDWFVYRMDRVRIVAPTDVWVIGPVPGKPDAQPTEALITLTTCNPRWASTERLIVFGHLESRRDKADGPPPQLLRRA